MHNRLLVLALSFGAMVLVSACGDKITQATEVNRGPSGPAPVTSVTITPDSVGLQHGNLHKCTETFQLNATVMPTSASQVLIWYSNDNRVVNVSPSGLITEVGVGTATVSATSATNSNVFATVKVVVTSPASCNTPPPPPPIDTTHHASGISVVLQPLPLPFHLGTGCSTNQVYQLIWEVSQNGARHSNQNVTFSSVQNGVVSLGGTGLVHPLKAGTALLIATAQADTMAKDTTVATVDLQACSGGGSTTASITVVAPAGTTMRIGTSQQLSATVGGAADPTGTWSSTRQQFLLVNSQSGMLSALSVGSSEICFFLRTNPTNIPQGCKTFTVTN